MKTDATIVVVYSYSTFNNVYMLSTSTQQDPIMNSRKKTNLNMGLDPKSKPVNMLGLGPGLVLLNLSTALSAEQRSQSINHHP